MPKLIYIQASPRGERSASIQTADAFLSAYKAANADIDVEVINLFDIELPPFGAEAAEGKYAILYGKDAPEASKDAWRKIESAIATFKSADVYLFAIPMWNFSIPYVLKQYFDVIVQPTHTFDYGENGYTGLVTDTKAMVVFSSGGDYTETPAYDQQKPYVRQILGFMGITELQEIIVAPMMGAADDVQARLEEASVIAKDRAKQF